MEAQCVGVGQRGTVGPTLVRYSWGDGGLKLFNGSLSIRQALNEQNPMQKYSPFDKPFQDLETADLIALKLASEGWYIEYKQEPPNAAALAKSLSAFANTYGGWLFLGVQELSKDQPVAGAFPGVAAEEADGVLQRLRKCAADHLNPSPHFETKLLLGPNAEIGLGPDRVVICVWIPRSNLAPHIHKSGSIYRRVADASEPKPENDRFMLDQLWRRSDDIKRVHREWFDRDPEFSKGERSRPYVRVMITPDPWDEHDVWINGGVQDVRDLLGRADGYSAIPFDTVHATGDGFIGRQLKGNDPQSLSLTWRLTRNLVSDVVIPLSFYEPDHPALIREHLKGYDHGQRFASVLSRHSTGTLRVVDLNYVFNILTGVAEIQARLAKLAGWEGTYYVKVKLLNAWRTVPFIDAPSVISEFEKFGLPMCMDSTSACPNGYGPDSFFEIGRFEGTDLYEAKMLIQSLRMFSGVANLFGVPAWRDFDETSGIPPYYAELQQAGHRAMQAQRLRSASSDK